MAADRRRVAFLMSLKAGAEREYEARHDAIWPELVDLLRASGISNYSIFRNGLDLFAYMEVADPAKLDRLPDEPVMRRWWAHMEPLMEYETDGTPRQTALVEAFHLD